MESGRQIIEGTEAEALDANAETTSVVEWVKADPAELLDAIAQSRRAELRPSR